MSAKRVVAVVQARMGASRLPNKMMLHLNGYPVVEWLYRRLSRASALDALVFAIPDGEGDAPLAWHLQHIGATVFRGSESDVLGRMVDAACAHGASHMVRVCADNPLICWREVDRLVEFFLAGGWDYAYNHIPRGNRYPDGLGAEIAGMDLMERIAREAREPAQREHAFGWLWARADAFRIGTFDPPEPELAHPEIRLDLDTAADYLRLMQAGFTIDMDGRQAVAAMRRMNEAQ